MIAYGISLAEIKKKKWERFFSFTPFYQQKKKTKSSKTYNKLNFVAE